MRDLKYYRSLVKNIDPGLAELRVALLGDHSTQLLAIALKGIAQENGYALNLFESDFDQIELQCLNRNSELHEFGADYVIIDQSTEKLLSIYDKTNSFENVSLALDRLTLVRDIIGALDARIIYCNYPEIDDSVFGSYSNSLEGSFLHQIRKLNFELMRLASTLNNFFVCDVSSLQNILGRSRLFSPGLYASATMIYSLESVPFIAKRMIDIVLAAEGRFKKCLILDLDNTLWGGVIGDDGLEGIQLGSGIGIGSVFSNLQAWAKKLKNRGVILAVCSKNSEDVAMEPFSQHPDMILSLDDISVFVANWNSKVDNIKKIQSILNVGFDSMVFLDDNPFERNLVRLNLPQVVVPEMPSDPSEYLEFLYSLNLFETVSYTNMDSERTKMYQTEAKRVSMLDNSENEEEFLENLEMVSEVKDFEKFNFPRIAQLTQRSNQFNLRTIRYSEVDIETISNDKDNYLGLSFSLSDVFGDHGLIGVIILEKQNGNTLFINTWLMSCRVLKRGMENFILNTLISYAKELGFSKIIGEYIPTPKNKIVSNHYSDLGFMTIPNKDNNHYELEVQKYSQRKTYIKKKI